MTIEQTRRSPESFSGLKNSRNLAVGGAILGAAMIADRAVPYFSHRKFDKQPTLISRQHEAEKDIYVFPGCRMDGRLIGQMLEPNFSRLGSTNYVVYPSSGFDIEPLKEEILESRQRNPEKPAVLIGLSMGFMAISNFFADKNFRNDFGAAETIVADSSPSGFEDIRRKTKMALNIAKYTGDSSLVYNLMRARDRQLARSVNKHLGVFSTEDVLTDLSDGSSATLPTAVAQSVYIKEFDVKNLDLPQNIAQNKFYIHADRDDIVDTDAAFRAYSQSYQDMTEVVDYDRPPVSHAAGAKFQRAMLDIINGQYNGQAAVSGSINVDERVLS